MKITFFVITFLLIASLPGTMQGGEESGGYAGSFLEWGAGARAISMGKTFTAIANDGTALFWNPAGLTQISSRELTATHALIFEDRSQNFLAFTFPLSRLSLSAGWLRFGVNDIQERGAAGELIGTFNSSENVFLLGAGYNLLAMPGFKLNLGVTAKYFYHSLHSYSASGVGADLGVLSFFQLSGLVDRIGVGVSAQNLGARLKWNTESSHEDDLPASFRVGTAVMIKPVPFKLALDLDKREKQDLRIHAGAEYWISMLALRAGWSHDHLTAGTGLALKLSRYGFLIDYAFTSDDVADKPLHFFSLGIRF